MVVLLLLGELLSDYAGMYTVEIVALNGEDHYSAQGQKEYLKQNAGKFDEILFDVNMDGVGYKEGKTAYSFYNLPPEIMTVVRKVFSSQEGAVEGEQWYQSDHMIFVQNGIPAVAITSDQFMHLSAHITHTPEDTPDLIDVNKLVALAWSLKTLFNTLK